MVKIRLARRGRKKLALYDIVVADARAPRDGRFIEKIGTYNPLTVPASVVLKDDRAYHWLMNGAQPSDTLRAVLSAHGILFKRHLQIGVNKGAITQEVADTKLTDWLNAKEAKSQSKLDTASKAKVEKEKIRKEAETKVREARAEAIRKKAIAEAVAKEATESAVDPVEIVKAAAAEQTPPSEQP